MSATRRRQARRLASLEALSLPARISRASVTMRQRAYAAVSCSVSQLVVVFVRWRNPGLDNCGNIQGAITSP